MKNSLYTFQLIICFCLLIFISSCGSDDKEDSGPAYEFLDQNLQGLIDGISFTYGEGTVEASSFEEGELSIDLYHSDEEITDICDFFGFGEEVSVFFSIPAEVGIYELFIDFESFDGQTVTLFNPDGAVNNIASIGAVEILSITDTQVKGRMDATLDGESTVNGNFTANFCPE